MNRRLLLALAVVTASASVLSLPSQAAVKNKPKPIKGTYTVSLLPDPSYEALATAGRAGCAGLSPKGKDSRPFAVPAAGSLAVSLVSADPTGGAAPVGFDWDLYLVDAGGEVVAESSSPAASEQVTVGFKHKQAVSMVVCNNTGEPSGTVSYTFTYK